MVILHWNTQTHLDLYYLLSNFSYSKFIIFSYSETVLLLLHLNLFHVFLRTVTQIY